MRGPGGASGQSLAAWHDSAGLLQTIDVLEANLRRIIIAVLLVLIVITVVAYAAPRILRAAPPTQPIAFSHVTHVAEREISCAYCHRYVAESAVAGIPSVEICAGCHQVVAGNNPDVQQVMASWSNRQPIPWVRVYRVPDFVYFSHQMHIAADVACESCHGNVAAMEQIREVQTPTMGWCLSCHRERGAPTDCWTCHK